jgi:hypothetical protein
VTLDLVATGTGFVHKTGTLSFADQFAHDLVQGRQAALDRAEVPQLTLAALFSNGDIDGIFSAMAISMEFLWTSIPTNMLCFFMACLLGIGSVLGLKALPA